SVANAYGILNYGTTIFRFSDKKGFAWGSMYTGHTWSKEVEHISELSKDPGDGRRRKFAQQIYTNNHWDEALGLFIVENVRQGSSFRARGSKYDPSTILDQLLNETSQAGFWRTVVRHRLAFLEGHYTDNVPLK